MNDVGSVNMEGQNVGNVLVKDQEAYRKSQEQMSGIKPQSEQAPMGQDVGAILVDDQKAIGEEQGRISNITPKDADPQPPELINHDWRKKLDPESEASINAQIAQDEQAIGQDIDKLMVEEYNARIEGSKKLANIKSPSETGNQQQDQQQPPVTEIKSNSANPPQKTS